MQRDWPPSEFRARQSSLVLAFGKDHVLLVRTVCSFANPWRSRFRIRTGSTIRVTKESALTLHQVHASLLESPLLEGGIEEEYVNDMLDTEEYVS